MAGIASRWGCIAWLSNSLAGVEWVMCTHRKRGALDPAYPGDNCARQPLVQLYLVLHALGPTLIPRPHGKEPSLLFWVRVCLCDQQRCTLSFLLEHGPDVVDQGA